MRALSALAAATLVCSVTTQAEAAGFYLTDIGTRGMARGGAFIAAPDSLLALHYNPAGLSYLKGFQVDISLSPVRMNGSFQRKCPCIINREVVIDGMDAAALDAALEARYTKTAEVKSTLYIPFISAGYGIEALDTTLAAGIWGPNSGRHQYGELPSPSLPRFPSAADDMPNRYSGIQMKTIEVNFGIGFGMRPFKGMNIPVLSRLRIGGMLMGYQSGNDQTVHMWLNSDVLGNTPESTSQDVPIVFNFKESLALNWSVGANLEIIDGLTIGTSFRGQRNITAEGTIDATLPADLQDSVKVVGNQVNVALATAPIFRTGLQYEMPKLFRAEIAWVWEGWSAHDDVVITPKDISFDVFGSQTDLGVITARRGWQDTWSLRFGGELTVLEPMVTLQAGYFYEPSAIPTTEVNPSRIDLDKHGFSVGAAKTMYGVTLNLAMQYTHLITTNVTDSTQTQIAAFNDETAATDLLTHIGNGEYKVNYIVLSAGLSYAFDPLAAD